VENQRSVGVDYSYRSQLSEIINLRLGIKAGAVFNNIDLGRLNRISQKSNESFGNVNNYLNLAIGVGVYLNSEKYFV
jgi:hypothetical protein